MRYLDGPRPRLFAHRGAAGEAPENTLVAFAAGIAAGADRLELDVHATRDGEVVVIHDATLERTTDGTGDVKSLLLAELQRLDAGYRFTDAAGRHPYRGRGIRVPTLAELLAEFPEVPLNIEIKQDDPPIEAAVLAVLDRFGARSRTLLAAEEASIMARIRAATQDVVTSFSAHEVAELVGRHRVGDFDGYRPAGIALQIPPSFGDVELITAETVETAHRLGLEVHAWTINEESEMESLLALGVDGIMSDFPGRAAGVLKRLGLR
ncbi:MAG TPA: glycerophosphodiester phosphodiesterase [Candidatus Bathyarchaeia archaeon]|nr:glycerophosphodiester phosphodiesterase [Candidatus Bathyarchaeia archaeon]